MSNYVNITYSNSMPSSGILSVCRADKSWITRSSTVVVALHPPSGINYTHYKLWNFNNVLTQEAAPWQPLVTAVTGTLNTSISGVQYIYGQFTDQGSNTTNIITTSGIIFDWVSPSISSNVTLSGTFSALGYENADSVVLKNDSSNISLTISKTNIPPLQFYGADLTGLSIKDDTIYGDPTSFIVDLVQAKSYTIPITKVNTDSKIHMVKVDVGDGIYKTLTDYQGNAKSTLSGTYLNRISDVNYSNNSTSFSVSKFSTYGFATINKIEYLTYSQTAGYKNTTINLIVHVMDTAGENVENAPITFSGTGTSIGTFITNPVYTNSLGIATAQLQLTTEGTCSYIATLDGISSISQPTLCLSVPTSMSRSLARQLEQIRRTSIYTDTISNINTSDIAVPTISGSLENDLNNIRTLLKQLKGTSTWYDDPGTYFDPTNTDINNINTKQLNLTNIKSNTLDSKSIIVAINDSNSGNGFTVTSGSSGFLYNTSLAYADWYNKTGLPIFGSISHSTQYCDIGLSDDICKVSILSTLTNTEFKDSNNYTVYAKLLDGSDHGGSGEGTDVYIKLYSNNTPYNLSSSDPTKLSMVIPYRKAMNAVAEYEWQRTSFVNSFEGDTELLDDIVNLWAYTGASSLATSPSWTNTASGYLLYGSPNTLISGINTLNNGIGNRTYSEQNYITSNQYIATSINNLDIATKDVVESCSTIDNYIESVISPIASGVEHILPNGATYIPCSISGTWGSYLNVYFNGLLLTANTGDNGVNNDNDYGETSTSGITFNFDVAAGSNLEYHIKKVY